jgi:hypothetical protein
MTPLCVGPDSSLQFAQTATLRGLREDRLVEICRSKATDTSNNDLLALLMPLEHGTGADTELPPNGGGNRDLALCGE